MGWQRVTARCSIWSLVHILVSGNHTHWEGALLLIKLICNQDWARLTPSLDSTLFPAYARPLTGFYKAKLRHVLPSYFLHRSADMYLHQCRSHECFDHCMDDRVLLWFRFLLWWPPIQSMGHCGQHHRILSRRFKRSIGVGNIWLSHGYSHHCNAYTNCKHSILQHGILMPHVAEIRQ